MATNFGSMTIPELKLELEKFVAKKSGRQRELREVRELKIGFFMQNYG